MSSLIETIEASTQQRLEQAKPLLYQFARTLPELEILFDLKGQAAGQAIWKNHQPYAIRYNLDIAAQQEQGFVAEVVPHEVAHIIAGVCYGKVRPHGKEWQSVMHFFGISQPQRCHQFTTNAGNSNKQRRWTYQCACQTHQISTTRHNRVQLGKQEYRCIQCGEAISYIPTQ